MAKILNDLSLLDIAPPSIKHDKTVKNIIAAIDPELLKVSEAISEAFIISRVKDLPEPVLDLLAWQWHVDFYELAKSIEAKRELVLNSIQWHRKKGTRGAIISALEMLGVEAKFTAWYEEEENKNNPYTFAIDAKLTGDFWERVDWTKPTQTIRRAILESKAARSYMSRLYVYFEAETEEDITVGAGLFTGAHYEIKPLFKPIEEKTTLNIHEASMASPGLHYVVKPLFEPIDDKAILNVDMALVRATSFHYIVKPQTKPIDAEATLKFDAVSAGVAGSHYVVKPKSFSDSAKMSFNEAPAGFVGYHYDIGWQHCMESKTEFYAASAGFTGYHYEINWQHCMDARSIFNPALAVVQGINTTLKMKGV